MPDGAKGEYDTINYMKKLYLLIAFLGLACGSFAQEDSRLIINPGRETFIHFPSAVLGDQYTLTVFLPEEAVPLSRRYPVVYLLGAGPKQAEQAKQFLERYKALVVGVNFQEADYQNRAKIVEFISRELMPYIDTNYLTFTDPSRRVIAARGKSAALTAMELFAKPNLFGQLALAFPADAVQQLVLPAAGTPRVFVAGTQAELALAQQKLESLGLAYGEGFALAYAQQTASLFEGVDYGYLSAPAEKVTLKRLKGRVSASSLTLESDTPVKLEVSARLKNGREYAYVPVSLRISPPYFVWNARRGELSLLAGAEAGKVKISGGVDKKTFSVKIRLKKQ